MKLVIVAVGQKMPSWAQTAFDDYAKRFPSNMPLHCHTVKTEPRSGGKTTQQLQQAEAQRIQAAIASHTNKPAHIVALDERGARLNTQKLADNIHTWQQASCDVALLIGGPDGLLPELRKQAHSCVRLSDLTLPHALARVVLAEQLYRAWSIHTKHPYHRA